METHFQTSFIPKKPVNATRPQVETTDSHGVSAFMAIGVIAFVISILAAGGVYGWKAYIISQRDGYNDILHARQKEFNSNSIAEYKQIADKIDTAKRVLANHLSTTLIMDSINHFTSQGIRFISMDLSVGGEKGGNNITVQLTGYGQAYKVVAFQSDLFSDLENHGLRNVITSGAMSSPVQNLSGTVSFDMTLTINPEEVSYYKFIGYDPMATTTESVATSSAPTL